MRVLLIEDNQDDALLIHRSLAQVLDGTFEMECAGELQPGLDRLRNGGIDVVLLDLALPDSRGLETFFSVQAQFPDVPIVVLSGQRDEVLAIDAVRQGAQDYLVKGDVGGKMLHRILRYAIGRKYAEQQLHFKAQLLDSVREAVAATDVEGRVTYWGKGAEALYGYSAEEALGKPIALLVSAGDENSEAQRMQRLLESGSWNGQQLRQCRDGSSFWADTFISLVKDHTGSPCGFVTIERDITDRKHAEEKLRESEKRLRSVAQSAGDAIISGDDHGNIISWNRGAQNIFGYTEEEAVGKPLTLLMPTQYRKAHRDGLERLLVERTSRLLGKTIELSGLRKDGSEFPLELSLAIWETGDRLYYTAIVRDTTAQRKAAMLLAQKSVVLLRSNEALEKRVAERTAELSRANEQLERAVTTLEATNRELVRANAAAEEAIQAKSEFLANMSHELRTPLHAILGFANFGIKRHATATSERVRDYFLRIDENGRTLLSLVDLLLDVAKLESEKMLFDFRSRDLVALVNSVVAELSSLASEKNVSVLFTQSDRKCEAKIDEEKFTQVIRNLLSNALKFCPDGGTVRMDLSQEDASVRFTICDQGPGVPEEELETVFDKFVQSSRTKTGAGGTGLGLAICSRIIRGHGGRIWAENSPDGGARFTFEITRRVEVTAGQRRPST